MRGAAPPDGSVASRARSRISRTAAFSAARSPVRRRLDPGDGFGSSLLRFRLIPFYFLLSIHLSYSSKTKYHARNITFQSANFKARG